MHKTYVEINLKNIKHNIENIIQEYNDYKYYIGMVKSNAYNHGMKIVNTLIDSGINYLSCSSLSEVIEIRKYNKDIPVLCVEVINISDLDIANKYNTTLTVTNINYLKKLIDSEYDFKIHIKVDSGMNRLGVKDKNELKEMVSLIKKNKNLTLEGIYTHFATPGINDIYYDKQISNFKEITSLIDITKIPIVHLSSSFITVAHEKFEFANAIRIGTLMYGYNVSLNNYSNSIKDNLRKFRDKYYQNKYKLSGVIRENKLSLLPAFRIISYVMEIKDVKCGEFVGYGAEFIADKDIKVATIDIGYQSGIGSNTNNRYVLINNKKYKVIGEISMCMMNVLIDEDVKLNDEVIILGNSLTLGYMSRLNNKSIQHTLVTLGNDLPKKYIE